MISSRPLFSGFLLFLWQLTYMSALLTGLLHLPIEEYLPFSTAHIPFGRFHALSACSILFLAFYALLVWILDGRKKYILTIFAKIKIIVYFLLLTTGLLLMANLAGVLSLYGLSMPIVKLLHCFFALISFFLLLALPIINIFTPVVYTHKRDSSNP